MSPAPRIDSRVSALIEAWIAAADPSEHDRLLLDAAQSWTGCAALGLWRFRSNAWRPLFERGARDALPRAELVREVLADRLSADLLPGGAALVRTSPCGTALVLGGVNDRADLDLVEALLRVREALEDGAHDDLEPPPRRSGAAPS